MSLVPNDLQRSLRNRSTQDLRPEEAALCPLDDLLVYALRRVVHNNGAGLVVDLGVDACVADQVDDPLLALVLRQAEACGEVPAVMLALAFRCTICLEVEPRFFAALDDLPPVDTYLMSILWWILQ